MPAPHLSPTLALCAALAAAVVAAPDAPAHAAAMPMDWSSIVRQTIPAVVNIAIETITDKDGTPQRSRDVGTGFIVDPSGVILTNKHVIAGAFRITVTMTDRSQWNGTLIGASSLLDLAVVKIDVGHPLPYLKFADSDKAEVGEPVLLIGNPLGLGTSVSSGIVSAVHRSLMNTPIDDYIQTDAALNHGNSGGPMIDRDGNVLGVDTILVTNAAGEGSNGLGFAIASKSADYTLRHFLHPGSVTVGWIGVHIQEITPALQHAFNLPQNTGVLVTQTDADSPAARAGLKFGDVITRYGDATPASDRVFMEDVILTPLNKTVSLGFIRDGKPMTANVVVEQWRNMSMASNITSTMENADAAATPDLGLILAPISSAAKTFYNLSEPDGVVIAAVNPASEAFTNGIKAGDVLLAVQNQPVATPDQAMDAIAHAKANKTIRRPAARQYRRQPPVGNASIPGGFRPPRLRPAPRRTEPRPQHANPDPPSWPPKAGPPAFTPAGKAGRRA